MTLRAKLLLAQVPILAALVLLSVLHLWSVSSVGGAAQKILRDNYRSVLAAQRIDRAIERMDAAVRSRLADRSEPAESQLDANRQRFEVALQIAEGNITEPGEREAAATLRQHWQAYVRSVETLAALPGGDAARALFFEQAEPAFRNVKGATADILAMNQDAMVQKSDQARRVADQVSQVAALLALAALVLGVLVSQLVTARLLRPLRGLRDAARRLGAGALDARAPVDGRDEIAHVANDFNAMAERLQRYRTSSLGELLVAQQSAQSAIDSLPDPVVIFDARGSLAHANDAAEALLRVQFPTEAGDSLDQVEPAVREVLTRLRAHIAGGKGPYAPKDFGEAIVVGQGDGQRFLLPRATPVFGPSGGVEGATIVLQDITRLRRFDDLKNDLVATVAHEFRTPLTSLRMAVHLCLEGIVGPVTAKQTDLLQAAKEDCDRLQGIVDDLLDLARIASGRVEMRKVLVSVRNLVEGAVCEQQGLAQARQVQLAAKIAPLAPQKILADPERLGLVFANLINNAIRHTRAGGCVTVHVSSATSVAHFEVTDTGSGIPVEYQRNIFLRFFRMPGSPAGGAGLGLSIAKEIVEAHGGTIGVRSEPGQGSTFHFEVPLLAGRR